MSTSQNPVTGRMRKKFGTAIFSTSGGKNIVRAKPLHPKDPKTEKQLVHRQKFRLLAHFYEHYAKIIDTGYLVLKKDMTVFNLFLQANFKLVFDKDSKEPVIDYSRLLVSKGVIPRVKVIESGVGAEGITIRYETSMGLPKVSAGDELTAFARLKNGDFLITRQSRGSDETGILVLKYTDQKVEDVEFCYLFARSADGKMSSNSTYVALEL